jgi:tol-pal system protein YbgF
LVFGERVYAPYCCLEIGRCSGNGNRTRLDRIFNPSAAILTALPRGEHVVMIQSLKSTAFALNSTRLAALILFAGLAVLLAGGLNPLAAQSTRELANRIEQLERDIQALRGTSGADAAADMSPDAAAGVQVRVLKLEQLLEQLTGQVEEARFRVGQMSRELRQLSDDMNYRLAVLEQALGVPGAIAIDSGAPPQPRLQAAEPSVPRRVPPNAGDAPLSQPMSTQPGRMPSQTAPSAQIEAGPLQEVAPEGQMVLRTDGQGQALPANPNARAQPAPSASELSTVAPAPDAAPRPGAVSANQLAALPPPNRVSLPDGTPKEQYEYAFNFLTRNDFASAEVALRDFLTRHPEDPLAGNAQYWLGETYYVRGDYKQAAVEFMSGYQKYPRSNKGPDNLLKLGMSMASLGQMQGACTALNRIAKDYADAPEQIRRTAATQLTNLKCK